MPQPVTEPEAKPIPAPLAPSAMSRMVKEAEKAFEDRDYDTAASILGELLKHLGPKNLATFESLYFHFGLSHLLAHNDSEAEEGFKDCIKRYPNGEYTSRAYLGLGRACLMQDLPEKKNAAVEALESAAKDPKYKTEANLLLGRFPTSAVTH